MNKRVVVTGLGVIAPGAAGKDAFIHLLKSGCSGIRFFQDLKELEFGCCIGGRPVTEDHAFFPYIGKLGLEPATAIIHYALLAGLEAWTDAGFKIPEPGSDEVDYDTGIMIGSGTGPADIWAARTIPLTDSKNIKRLRSTIVEHSMLNGASATLCGLLGTGNQCTANASACSTGNEAIIGAFERIRCGKAIRMLAGASEATSPYCWSPFDALRVTTREYNDRPEKGSRPMSAGASGFVPSGGAAVLVLEELESAVKRGATVYAELCGGAVNSGGQRRGGSMTAPSSEGVIRCIKEALCDASVSPADIDYISGHLSSTMADPLEIANWVSALDRGGKNFPQVNSTKSLIGHAVGAAGAVETTAAILQMYHGFLHPSINCEDLHPAIADLIDEHCVVRETISNVDIRCAAKASFGFGDVNSCLILKKYRHG